MIEMISKVFVNGIHTSDSCYGFRNLKELAQAEDLPDNLEVISIEFNGSEDILSYVESTFKGIRRLAHWSVRIEKTVYVGDDAKFIWANREAAGYGT